MLAIRQFRGDPRRAAVRRSSRGVLGGVLAALGGTQPQIVLKRGFESRQGLVSPPTGAERADPGDWEARLLRLRVLDHGDRPVRAGARSTVQSFDIRRTSFCLLMSNGESDRQVTAAARVCDGSARAGSPAGPTETVGAGYCVAGGWRGRLRRSLRGGADGCARMGNRCGGGGVQGHCCDVPP
jgi:hypothetical protein